MQPSFYPTFRLPSGLAGRARGLRGGPENVAARADEVLQLLHDRPRQRLVPAVRVLEVMDHLTVTQWAVPANVLPALAAVLGVEKHVVRTAVLSGPLSNAEAATQLGISERTVRRWRAEGLGPAVVIEPLELSDRFAMGGRRREGVAEALYDLAAAEVTAGTYFSANLLWALAEVLGVALRDKGLTRAATEAIHAGLRDPERFMAAGLADPEGDMPVRTLASVAGVDRSEVKRWRDPDSSRSTAFRLNQLAARLYKGKK